MADFDQVTALSETGRMIHFHKSKQLYYQKWVVWYIFINLNSKLFLLWPYFYPSNQILHIQSLRYFSLSLGKFDFSRSRASNTRGAGGRGGGGRHPPPLFFVAKRKKGDKGNKKKGFKAETITRLSPRSKYYCFNHSRVSKIRNFFLLANHGGRQYFSVFHN